MNVALTNSVAGMQAATDRLAIRARNVANVQTPGYKASDVVQEATGSGPVVSERLPVDQVSGKTPGETGTPVPPEQFSLPFDDLPEEPSDVSLEYELTDMILAEHAYKASASVARTVGTMQDTLLDIFT